MLDCYFTSYFNAWLDNHNLYTGPKKVVTAFTPDLNMDLANIESFFSDYPDGTLISSIRDPAAWYNSARKLTDRHEDLDGALQLWRVRPERTSAYRDSLDATTIARIEDVVGDLYAKAKALAS